MWRKYSPIPYSKTIANDVPKGYARALEETPIPRSMGGSRSSFGENTTEDNESASEIVVIGDAVFEPGTMIAHYEIVRRIGKGGMSVVFLARDTRLARLVAIKILKRQSGTNTARFLSEGRMTARCRHENIVVIYEVGETRGCPYMVFEYVEGTSFRDVIEKGSSPMSVNRAIELVIPAVRAVVCAHASGIIHRDLKPENILLGNDGSIKVLDFGISKPVAKSPTPFAPATNEEEMLVSTHPGALLGTVPYMSPEQWRFEPLDGGTDIWALGIILFELLTGAHPLGPFPLTTRALSSIQNPNLPMPSLREKRPDAGDLVAVVDRCLAKRKEDRFQSAAELLETLESIRQAKP